MAGTSFEKFRVQDPEVILAVGDEAVLAHPAQFLGQRSPVQIQIVGKLLTVKGKNLQEVAHFVAAKLATIDGVMSTSTAFMLRKYKESGRIMEDDEEYERLKICF